jgi:hypothetical protein
MATITLVAISLKIVISICHRCISPFCLTVKDFRRSTASIHITKDIDKMARMGDIATAASG